MVEAYLEVFESLIVNPIRKSSVQAQIPKRPFSASIKTNKAAATTKKAKTQKGKKSASNKRVKRDIGEDDDDDDDIFEDGSDAEEEEEEEEEYRGSSQLESNYRKGFSSNAAELELSWRLVAEMNRDGEASRYLSRTCSLLLSSPSSSSKQSRSTIDATLLAKLQAWADISARIAFSGNSSNGNKTTSRRASVASLTPSSSSARTTTEASWRLLSELTMVSATSSSQSISAAAWVNPASIVKRWNTLKSSGSTNHHIVHSSTASLI